MPHRTFLLTWNPIETTWVDLKTEVEQTAAGVSVVGSWSCGNTQRISPGDRIFVLRQRKEPRGIVASGWVVKSPESRPHWDDDLAERGVTAWYVDIEFDRVLDAELDGPLPLASLKQGTLAGVHWSTQRSGIEIKVGTDLLEGLWSSHLASFDTDSPAEFSAMEGSVLLSLRRHRARERWLRDAKLAATKIANNGRLRCEVPGCGFDFYEVYGEIGRDFAHVHHLRPLGEMTRPSETTLGDLAVVCANCHAMIHRGNVTRPLEELLTTRINR